MKVLLNMLAGLLLLPGVVYSQVNDHKKKEDKMEIAQQNKAIIHRLYEQVLNTRHTALLEELVSPEYTGFQGLHGAAAFAAPVTPLLQGFPDAQWQVQSITAEGDTVVAHWKFTGTHTDLYLQIPPTGKKVASDGMGIFTLQQGKIISGQVLTDRLGFLQQLEVLPNDPFAFTAASRKNQVQFIDKFLVPPAAQQEFLDRTRINRAFIKTLPGFITDAAYTHTDNAGNLVCVTVATWASQEALDQAKTAVQAAYKAEGFDPAAMLQRLHITMDRGIYTLQGEQ